MSWFSRFESRRRNAEARERRAEGLRAIQKRAAERDARRIATAAVVLRQSRLAAERNRGNPQAQMRARQAASGIQYRIDQAKRNASERARSSANALLRSRNRSTSKSSVGRARDAHVAQIREKNWAAQQSNLARQRGILEAARRKEVAYAARIRQAAVERRRQQAVVAEQRRRRGRRSNFSLEKMDTGARQGGSGDRLLHEAMSRGNRGREHLAGITRKRAERASRMLSERRVRKDLGGVALNANEYAVHKAKLDDIQGRANTFRSDALPHHASALTNVNVDDASLKRTEASLRQRHGKIVSERQSFLQGLGKQDQARRNRLNKSLKGLR